MFRRKSTFEFCNSDVRFGFLDPENLWSNCFPIFHGGVIIPFSERKGLQTQKCLFVCLSVRLSVCPSVCLSVCLSVQPIRKQYASVGLKWTLVTGKNFRQ